MTAGNGSLNMVPMNRGTGDNPSHIFDALTATALSKINAALQGHTGFAQILGASSQSGQKMLPFAGGIDEQDMMFLTEVLWQDRKSFLTLCNRGLLNGSTTLFFVASTLGRRTSGAR